MDVEARKREELLLEIISLREQVADLRASHAYGELAQRALNQAIEQADLIHRVIPAAVFTVDENRHINSWNAKSTELTGFSEVEMIGQGCHTFALSCYVDCPLFDDRVQKPLFGRECTIRRKDGEIRTISINCDRMRSIDGNLAGGIESFEDITERKAAEEALKASEERLMRERDFVAAVIDTVGSLVVVTDPRGKIERFNSSCERTSGYTQAEVIGKSPWQLFGPDPVVASRMEEAMGKLVPEQFPDSRETRWRSRNGDIRLISWYSTTMLSPSGEIEHIISSGTDVTEQRQTQQALIATNEQLTAQISELENRTRQGNILNEMGDLLQSCVTRDEAYSVIAHSAQELFPDVTGGLFIINEKNEMVDAVATWGDYPEDERVFAPDECWGLRRSRVHSSDSARSGMHCRHVHEPLPSGYICVPLIAQDKTTGLFHLRAAAPSTDSAPQSDLEVVPGQQVAVTVAEHIALSLANLELRESLRAQAIHDQLTGLYNRRHMEDMLEREVHRASRRKGPLGILMLDIDHFKRFNDSFGHEAGDQLLAALGQYLRAHVRAEDIPCRYGGEEVAIIMPDASAQQSHDRAEQLRSGIKGVVVTHRGLTLGPITVSIGVAAYPEHGLRGWDVMHAADGALYVAKAEGRDRVCLAKQQP